MEGGNERLFEPLIESDESSFEQVRSSDAPVPIVSRPSSNNNNNRPQGSSRRVRRASGSRRYDGRFSNSGTPGFQDRWRQLMNQYQLEREESCLTRLWKQMKTHWNSLRTPQKEEGLDFDSYSNKLYTQRLDEINKNTEGSCLRNVELMRWLTGFVIAIVVSCLAIGVEVVAEILREHKYDRVRHYMRYGHYWKGFGYYFGLNSFYVSIAAILVAFLDLKAKGSGVPEIKSYLNGRKIHRVISLRTLLSKLAGVVFSVSGSLVLGKEGPMMHAGAVVGAIISQGRDEFVSFGLSILSFRSDLEKRAFVSIGCACGVAAAFSAPLGGVLFVIEEAASYWSVRLTWLTFFATMVCAAFVDVVLSGVKDSAEWGLMSQSAVVSFGSFEGASKDECYPVQPPYRVLQIPIFIGIGALGGLAGVSFNKANLWLSRKRLKYIVDPTTRVMEVLLVSLITSLLFFGVSYFYPCRAFKDARYSVWSEDDPQQSGGNQTCAHLKPLDTVCHKVGDFSDLETLMLNSLDSAVKQLFHSELLFEYGALMIYGCSVFFLACVTYGTSIPSGLFVPAITIGAAFGRIFGQLLWEIDDGGKSWGLGTIDPGTYALIGSAAMLSGITRMTISIVVILMETTNNSTYAIPIMITIMSAKVVGDLFTEGLYDMHIELQGIKFMHDEPPSNSHRLRVRDVMVKKPVVFNLFERVGDVIDTLQNCTHNGFPVVSSLDIYHHHPSSGTYFKVAPTNNNNNKDKGNGSEDQVGPSPSPSAQTGMPAPPRFASHRSFDGSSNPVRIPELERNVEARAKVRTNRRRRRRKILMKQNNDEEGHDDGDSSDDMESEAPGNHVFGVFEGMVLRSQLLILIYERVFVDDSIPLLERMQRKQATINWRDFYKHYPRSPSIRDVCERLKPEDFDRVMDLRPYLNSSALTVHHSVYLTRVHELFRHLGLRHLTVVNTMNQVVGIVTRNQLTDSHIEQQVKIKSQARIAAITSNQRHQDDDSDSESELEHFEEEEVDDDDDDDDDDLNEDIDAQNIDIDDVQNNNENGSGRELTAPSTDEASEMEHGRLRTASSSSPPRRVLNSWKNLESKISQLSLK